MWDLVPVQILVYFRDQSHQSRNSILDLHYKSYFSKRRVREGFISPNSHWSIPGSASWLFWFDFSPQSNFTPVLGWKRLQQNSWNCRKYSSWYFLPFRLRWVSDFQIIMIIYIFLFYINIFFMYRLTQHGCWVSGIHKHGHGRKQNWLQVVSDGWQQHQLLR